MEAPFDSEEPPDLTSADSVVYSMVGYGNLALGPMGPARIITFWRVMYFPVWHASFFSIGTSLRRGPLGNQKTPRAWRGKN